LVTDELSREWGYVALSRAREETRIYAVGSPAPERTEWAPSVPRVDGRSSLVRGLGRSEAQSPASDVSVGQERIALERQLAEMRERLAAEPPAWFRRSARREHDAGRRRLRIALALGEQRLELLRREEVERRPATVREAAAPRRALGRGIER
jgi:hypothetical protein